MLAQIFLDMSLPVKQFKQFSPSSAIKDSVSKRTLHSGEEFIMHDMMLGRDHTSAKIKDSTNSRGMSGRGAKTHALT